MKFRLLTVVRAALWSGIASCSLLGTMSYAEEIVEKGDLVNESGGCMETLFFRKDVDQIVRYDSIQCGGIVTLRTTSAQPNGSLSIEVGSISAPGQGVYISTPKGNITLGDIRADYVNVSTNDGDITLTGKIDLDATDGSTIVVQRAEGASGSIILDGATLSNVSLEVLQGGATAVGAITLSGNATLSNVCFNTGSVVVEEGSHLVLDAVSFNNRNATNNEEPPSAALELGDNVTLTLCGGKGLNVTDLTIGNGVDIVVELSAEEFASLDGSEIEIFSVDSGAAVDLSSVSFTFTDGEQMKSGLITSEGGTITVTGSYNVPEPTGAALSLLALVGLASRRRRC